MVLATLIRIEMAYPGIGILAGDNAQYLTIVSAHGVIMVFFMAMPLLFGFFTNFLLPTQLGVHDVAFPRMNSAAFWFLPASLIVLCQLVCIDRRYQRMNCFNIKELQSIVRKKFFFELMDENVYNEQLANTLIGFKKNIDNENNVIKYNKYNLHEMFTKDIVAIVYKGFTYINETTQSIVVFLKLYIDIVLKYTSYVIYIIFILLNYFFFY